MHVSLLFLCQDESGDMKVRTERLLKNCVYRFGTISKNRMAVQTFMSRPWGGLCWMSKSPIGRDESKISWILVLYRDWLYQTKMEEKFWMAKMVEV